MKYKIILAISLLIGEQMFAQPVPNAQPPQGGKHTFAQRKFSVLLLNEEDPAYVRDVNGRIQETESQNRSGDTRGLLGDALKTALSTTLMSKTTNTTSNVLSFAISSVKEATKSKRGEWYKEAQQQCTFTRKLSSSTYKDDFYALPSQKSAMDPQNMRFKGFGLQHYIETTQQAEQGQEVFKVFCNVRKDKEGINSMVNHGKFLVDIDEFYFNPTYCGLPNDSNSREIAKFDFNKREKLNLSIKVKFFSSWLNEAIMLTNDQQIGEFIINANITPEILNDEGLFVYDSTNPKHREHVSISGDCFMVPRSFTGTVDAKNYTPSWGTGEYRVEMEISETCKIKDSYYQIRESGNGEAQAFAALPGKTRWDKAKWKTEWTSMQQVRRDTPFFKGMWQSIVTAVKGSGWIETFTDPLTTAIISTETVKLNEWLKIPQTQGGAQSSAKQNPNGAGGVQSQQGAQQGAKPQGNQPLQGSNKPPVK